jgi:hypothetical protein
LKVKLRIVGIETAPQSLETLDSAKFQKVRLNL